MRFYFYKVLVFFRFQTDLWSSIVLGWEEFTVQVCFLVPNKPKEVQNGHKNQRQYTSETNAPITFTAHGNHPAPQASHQFFTSNFFCTKSRYKFITKTDPDTTQVHQNSNHQHLEATKQETNPRRHCPQTHFYKEKYLWRSFISLNNARYSRLPKSYTSAIHIFEQNRSHAEYRSCPKTKFPVY